MGIQNFPLLRNKSTGHIGAGEHQRLGRSADVSQLWSSPSLMVLRVNRSRSSDIYDETYNSSTPTSSQNNIYEDIEGSQSSVGTTSNSLYFCISEGRRNQLKLHKNVDWDHGEQQESDTEDFCQQDKLKDDETIDASSNTDQDKIVHRKRLQLKKSISRTCSSIIESIKSLF